MFLTAWVRRICAQDTPRVGTLPPTERCPQTRRSSACLREGSGEREAIERILNRRAVSGSAP